MALNPTIAQGPIPGENFTSDPRNYPWHRPPDITDLDQAVEFSIKRLTQKDNAYALLTMLQAGVTVVTATDMFVTSGIGQGKWTPDFAILLAGPVAHMIKLMADGYGIKYNMGLGDEPPATLSFLQAQAELDPKKVVTVADQVANEADLFKTNADNQQGKPNGVGFMGSPDPSMQGQAATPQGNPMMAQASQQQGSPQGAPSSGFMGMPQAQATGPNFKPPLMHEPVPEDLAEQGNTSNDQGGKQ